MNRALIVANGDLEKPGLMKKLITGVDFIVAVDGGLGNIRGMDMSPDLVIGDLDSIRSEDREWLDHSTVEVIRFPKAKDQTDLELAMLEVYQRGFKTILVLAALGGRIDHALANIALLASSKYTNLNIRIRDWDKELFFIHSSAMIEGSLGDIVSLIPFGREVKGIITENLAYPLINETLFPEQARGVSNTMTADQACVTVKEGLLLCIHFFMKEK